MAADRRGDRGWGGRGPWDCRKAAENRRNFSKSSASWSWASGPKLGIGLRYLRIQKRHPRRPAMLLSRLGWLSSPLGTYFFMPAIPPVNPTNWSVGHSAPGPHMSRRVVGSHRKKVRLRCDGRFNHSLKDTARGARGARPARGASRWRPRATLNPRLTAAGRPQGPPRALPRVVLPYSHPSRALRSLGRCPRAGFWWYFEWSRTGLQYAPRSHAQVIPEGSGRSCGTSLSD